MVSCCFPSDAQRRHPLPPLLLLLLLLILHPTRTSATDPGFGAGPTLELVTFRTIAGASPLQLLAAARNMTPWLKSQQGFRDRALAVKADGSWIDTVRWGTRADAIAAAQRIVSAPECRPFLARLDNRTVELHHARIEYELTAAGRSLEEANITVAANGTVSWTGATLEFSPFTLNNNASTGWALAVDLAKAMAPFLLARPGFVNRATTVTPTSNTTTAALWHDVLHWRTRVDAMSAAAAAPSSPVAARYFAVMNTSSIYHAAIVLAVPPTPPAPPPLRRGDSGLFKSPVDVAMALVFASFVSACVALYVRFGTSRTPTEDGVVAAEATDLLGPPQPRSSYGVA